MERGNGAAPVEWFFADGWTAALGPGELQLPLMVVVVVVPRGLQSFFQPPHPLPAQTKSHYFANSFVLPTMGHSGQ
jgi:hypothetical protein